MSFKGVLAGSASIVAILAVTPAFAQSQTGGVETVVVTGIRASNQRAIDIKKDSTELVDAVSAEDIGKFPDKNVADALQRVPGVNTVSAASGEGGFDENDRVSIRGTNPSLTQTMVDGHSIANGDWFILDQFSTVGRSVSYTLLPSEIVDTAKVYKSQSADLIEGGVAGVVDIQTRKPLDFTKSLTLEGTVQANYGDLSGKFSPQVNGLIAWQNDAGTFGILAQGFYEERHVRRDGQEFLGYATVGAGDATGVAIPGLVGDAYPTLIGAEYFIQKREREGGDLTIQYKPDSHFDATLSGFYSHLGASNFNENYMFWGTNEFQHNVPTSYTVKNGTVVQAAFPNGQDGVVMDAISRPGAAAETYFIDGDAHYRPNDNWTLHAKVGYTHGVGLTPEQPAWEGDAVTAASYNFATGGPAVVAFPSINTSDPSALGNDWSWNDKFTAVDREYYGQADATWNINTSVLNSLEAGVRYAEHKRTVLGYDHGTFVGGTFAGVSTGHYPNDYADGFKVPGLLVGLPLGDPTKIANAVEPNTPFLSPWFYWPGSFGVKEGDLAGYAQANVGADKWNGNFGVRVVQTADTIDQYVSDAGGISNLYGNYSIDVIKHTYVDVLPSANLNIDVADDMKLRFAAAETMARPDYSALGGSVSLTDLNLTGNGGNPDLKPIKAATYNASYEWYYGPQSLLSVAVFYNDLSSYVSYATHQGTYVNATLTAGHAIPVYSVYTISSPINSSGYVQGVEFSWQQPIWNDFGVIANYTYADGADNNGGPLVGDSKDTLNITGYYEANGLSARLAYTYRSKFLLGLDRSSAENEQATGSLDMSVNYDVTDNISLTFDAMNLTDDILKYYAANTSQSRAFYDNGRQFYLGVSLKN